MERSGLIYLDNAATSFPKPLSVIEGVRRFMLFSGGNAGRGSHRLALEAAKTVYECRSRLAEFFDADGEEQVCFTLNTTHSLNVCIKGLLRKGDHVLISDIEHNAVYRPIFKLADEGFIAYDVFPSLVNDEKRNAARICAEIAKRVRKETRMLICTGASNICSATMPLAQIGAFCRRHGILFVVDGAQCAGHYRISVRDMRIDALCIPAHKGLLGPQGCGAVIFGKGVSADTLIEGGNGVASLEGAMGSDMPERYEAGTLPTPAIAGFFEGVGEVARIGLDRIRYREELLFRYARERLGNINGVSLCCPWHEGSVLTFNVDGKGSEEVARLLSEQGICVRGGYHCSALGHKTLGTLETGGVRASFSFFNDLPDVDSLCLAVKRIVK